MIKKIFSVIVSFGLLAGFYGSGFAEEPKLVASQWSDRYHQFACKIAKKIDPRDLMVFKTPEEATGMGLVPCKKCNPPTQSN